MGAGLTFLMLIWIALLLILITGLVTGKMLVHGSKGGGMGIGHLADRKLYPGTFWLYAGLYGALCLYFFIGTDGFTYLEGISKWVGRKTPIA